MRRGALRALSGRALLALAVFFLAPRYDDRPDGKLEVAEFAELVRDLEQGVVRSSHNAASRSPYGGGPNVPARVAAAFEEHDANRSGFLDYGELRGALRRYGINLDEGEAASIVRAYDDRPDGKLDSKCRTASDLPLFFSHRR